MIWLGLRWEIHPVLRIVVDRGGTWIDLATGKVDTGAAPPARVTPQPTPATTATLAHVAEALTLAGHADDAALLVLALRTHDSGPTHLRS